MADQVDRNEGAEFWKNVTEVVKNIVTTAAIVVGGIWTYHTFHALRQEREAEAKIAEIQASTAQTQAAVREADMKAKNFPLEIEIATSVMSVRQQHVIAIDASFRNAGAGPLNLDFAESAFQLARINPTATGTELSFVAKGSPAYLVNSSIETVPDRRLLAQQRRHMPYVFRVPDPGLYLVQVNVGYGDENASSPQTFAFEQAVVRVN